MVWLAHHSRFYGETEGIANKVFLITMTIREQSHIKREVTRRMQVCQDDWFTVFEQPAKQKGPRSR